MKHKWKTSLIAVLMSAVMVFMPLSSSLTVLAAEKQNASVNTAMTGENWMGYLPNTTKLTEINLPGTHDSGTAGIMTASMLTFLVDLNKILLPLAITIPIVGGLIAALDVIIAVLGVAAEPVPFSLGPFAQDQSLYIPDQFKAGVRLLDCRLSNYKGQTDNTDDLEFSHGGIRCTDKDGNNLTMKSVLNDAKAFVKANPSETVVLGLRSESFFPVPDHDDNWFLDAVFKTLHEVILNDLFDGVDLAHISSNAESLIKKLIEEELPKDPDVMIVNNKAFPTVGEARGKVIVCYKDGNTEANMVHEYNDDGNTKWNALESYFNSTGVQDYAKSSNPLAISESSCTGGDGTYMGNAVKILLSNMVIVKPIVALLETLGIIAPAAASGGEVQSKIVNPKFKAYDLKKGNYYGWMYMDFADEELLSHYYQSNVFDFDVAGKPVEYISDIVIAYDQQFENAQKNLKDAGYKVLEHNVNAEGPDKGLSDAIVNGIKNNGSFNMAVGYKTSTNILDAITGIIWVWKLKEGDPLDAETKALIDKYHFQLVQTAGTKIETDKIKALEGFYDLNIGTSGQLVNLYVTKDQGYGERLIALESIQSYNKADTDVNTGEPYPEEDIILSEEAVADRFDNLHFEMPRDINGFVLSSNYCRNEINDVYLFYNSAFNDPNWASAYIKPYNGPHAGELYEIHKEEIGGNDGMSGDVDSTHHDDTGKAGDTGITNTNTDLLILLGLIVLAVAGLIVVQIVSKRKRKV